MKMSLIWLWNSELGRPSTRLELSIILSVLRTTWFSMHQPTFRDVAEPVQDLDDATPVRPDDRLRWSGRVVYEGISEPAPNDLGITVEVFDGVQYWSDGSLSMMVASY